jgi:hypothetical protein
MKPNGDLFFNELTKNLKQMEKTASSPEVSATNAPQSQTTQKTTQTTQSPKVAEVIEELVKIAEELDSNGSTKAADLVDRTIKKLALNEQEPRTHEQMSRPLTEDAFPVYDTDEEASPRDFEGESVHSRRLFSPHPQNDLWWPGGVDKDPGRVVEQHSDDPGDHPEVGTEMFEEEFDHPEAEFEGGIDDRPGVGPLIDTLDRGADLQDEKIDEMLADPTIRAIIKSKLGL